MLMSIPKIHIALDLDEVISPFLPHLTTYYINKYHKGNMNYYRYYMSKSNEYKYTSIFNLTDEDAKLLVKDFYNSREAKKIRPYSTSVKTIHNLKKRNVKFSIVTGRQTYKESKKLTHMFVGKYFGSCIDNIYFTNSYSLEGDSLNKLDVCTDINATILVDDCVSNFESESQVLTIQYLHNPIHNWTDDNYKNNITHLEELEKYL